VPQPPRPVALPEASWAFYDHLLRLDADGRWWFEALWTPEREGALAHAARSSRRGWPPGGAPPARVRHRPVHGGADAGGARRGGPARREYIAAGDLYQANLTLRLDAASTARRRPVRHDLVGADPRRGAYVGDRDAQVGLAVARAVPRAPRPARCARRRSRAPVRRTGDPAELEALRASAKDAAEHVMIVDLMRNDLGRVSAYGSVHAPLTPRAEEHPGVWHLVSDVTGTLRDDVADADLLRATFPPGSVTGAPKVKALEVIATLESTGPRGLHRRHRLLQPRPRASSSTSPSGRSRSRAAGRGWASGVASSPTATRRPSSARRSSRPPRCCGRSVASCGATTRRARSTVGLPAPVRDPRPDPAAGILETLLAVDGRLIEADAHLARLDRSLREVFGRPLGDDERTRVLSAAAAPGASRASEWWRRPGASTSQAAPAHPSPLRPGGARAARPQAARAPQVGRPRAARSRAARPARSCSSTSTAVLETGRSILYRRGTRLVHAAGGRADPRRARSARCSSTSTPLPSRSPRAACPATSCS
jgi:para-aminobenzoate synthetase/4-amino-4-deoxychorismate lyase